jgi:transposase
MGAEDAIRQLEEAQAILAQKETLLSDYAAKMEALEAALQQKESRIASLQFDYDNLQNQIANLQKRIFGRKSERFVPGSTDPMQGDLFSEVDFGQDAQTEELVLEELQKETKKILKGKGKSSEGDDVPRMELPENLEREVIIIDPEGIDLDQAVKIGEEVTEQLVITPAVVKVRRYIRNKYVYKGGEEALRAGVSAAPGRIFIASLPDEVMLKIKCSHETLAWMLVSKYVDHLPVYRQESILARSGIRIKYNTLANWVQQGANRLNILLEALKKILLESRYLMADETPCNVIDHTEKKHVVQGYYWVYRAYDVGLVLFDFQPSRSGQAALSMLKGYKGYVQCDGYKGYDKLFEENPEIRRVGCLALARRKFDQAKNSDKTRSEAALTLIQSLYAVERQAAKEAEGMEQEEQEAAIKAYRLLKAEPIWKEFEAWLKDNYPQVRPKSPIYEAIRYTLNELKSIKTYLEQGYIRIDNNWVENNIRPTALGRKNYLYAGSPKTAQNSALIYSLLESCRLNKINPYEYLLDVLRRIPETSIQQIHTLLPHNWRKN